MARSHCGCIDCWYFGVERDGKFYCLLDTKREYPLPKCTQRMCFMKLDDGRQAWLSMFDKPSRRGR